MFKVLDKVCEPKRGTKYSAYVDLFAREDVVIGAGDTKIIPLGVALDIGKLYKDNALVNMEMFMKSHYLEVALRSSLGAKGLIIANGIGIIDLDFTNECGLIVHFPYNGKGASHFEIKKGDKVGQCTIKEHKGYLMGYESDAARNGGFGSTGA